MVDPTNPQCFASSSLVSERVDPALDLHGSRDPNLSIVHEKPEHRVILMHKAAGLSNHEVAVMTGYTDAWISQVTRQPWFRQRLLSFMQETGRDTLQGLLEGAAEDCVFKLIDLRDKAKNEATQLAATNSLLDRFLGKPTQHVKTENTENKLDAVVEIDKQLDLIKKQQSQLVGEGARN